MSALVGAPARAASGLVGVVVLFFLPEFVSGYWLFVSTQSLVQVLAVLSIVVLFRATALVSLGQAALMGIGAYAMTWAAENWDVPYLAAALFGITAAAGVGIVLALPALRLRGLELSVLTLVGGLAATSLLFSPSAPIQVTAYGALLSYPGFAGVEFAQPDQLYRFVLIVVFLAMALVVALTRSRVGKTWMAMRAGQAAAASVGIPITRVRVSAFAFSAALAGAAGVLLLTVQTTADAGSFGPVNSLLLVVAAMLGGINRPLGAIIGGLTVGLGPAILGEFGLAGDWLSLGIGIGIIIVIVISGGGIKASARDA